MSKTSNSLVEHLNRLFPVVFPIAIILFLVADFSLLSFYMAETPQEVINAGREALPTYWDAGVFSHGSYYRWFTVANHPFLFGLSITLFFGSWFLLLVTAISKKNVLSKKSG